MQVGSANTSSSNLPVSRLKLNSRASTAIAILLRPNTHWSSPSARAARPPTHSARYAKANAKDIARSEFVTTSPVPSHARAMAAFTCTPVPRSVSPQRSEEHTSELQSHHDLV